MATTFGCNEQTVIFSKTQAIWQSTLQVSLKEFLGNLLSWPEVILTNFIRNIEYKIVLKCYNFFLKTKDNISILTKYNRLAIFLFYKNTRIDIRKSS